MSIQPIRSMSAEALTTAKFGAGYVVLFLTSLAAQERLPMGMPAAIAVGGALDLARRVHALSSAMTSAAVPSSPSDKSNASLINSCYVKLPANLIRMDSSALARFNEGKVVQMCVEGADRIGVSIDASQLEGKRLRDTLHYVFDRYPETCFVEIRNYHGEGTSLVEEIVRYSSISRLSFVDCPRLQEVAVRSILEGNKALDRVDPSIRLKQLHVDGCTKLSKSFCQQLATEFGLMIRFPDRTTNREALELSFYNNMKVHTKQILMKIIEAKKRDGAHQAHLGDLILLEQMFTAKDPSKREIKEQITKLSAVLDPWSLDEEVKHEMVKSAEKLAAKMLERADISVLDDAFFLDLRKMIAADWMMDPFFRFLQYLRANVSHVDISESFLTGTSLEWLQGLPIHTVTMNRLPKFLGRSLHFLGGFPSLVTLDVSETALNDASLIQGVMELKGLRTLRLDGCVNLTESGLRSALFPMIASSLEYLSVVGVPSMKKEVVNAFIAQGNLNLKKPLVIVYDKDGSRCIDVSRAIHVDARLKSALGRLPDEPPVKSLSFGAKSQLCRRDFVEELFPLRSLQITNLDLRKVSLDPDVYPVLMQKWPISSIQFTEMEVHWNANTHELHIKGDINPTLIPFLKSFPGAAIVRLEMNLGDSPEAKRERLKELAPLFVEKKIERLVISDPTLQRGELEDLGGDPIDPVKVIMNGYCTSIHFVADSPIEELYKRDNAKENLSGLSCRVTMGREPKPRDRNEQKE